MSSSEQTQLIGNDVDNYAAGQLEYALVFCKFENSFDR